MVKKIPGIQPHKKITTLKDEKEKIETKLKQSKYNYFKTQGFRRTVQSIKAKLKLLEQKELVSNRVLELRKEKPKLLSDFFYFCKCFYPETYKFPFASFQKEMFESWESLSKNLVLNIAPREHGKTTLMQSYIIWKFLRNELHCCILVSETKDKAMDRLTDIFHFVTENRFLDKVFKIRVKSNRRDLKVFRSPRDDVSLTDETAFNELALLPYGESVSPRGVKYGHWRPELIVIDDFETNTSRSLDKAFKKQEYIRGECGGAVPTDIGTNKVVFFGNLTHDLTALNLLYEEWRNLTEKDLENHPLDVKYYQAYTMKEDGTYDILWKERYDMEFFIKKRKEIGAEEFRKHYLNIPQSSEHQEFNRSWVKRYDKDLVDQIRFKQLVTYIDPSLGSETRKGTSDKALCTIGVKNNGDMYLVEHFLDHIDAKVFLHKIVEIMEKVNNTFDYYLPHQILFEVNFGQKYLYNDLVQIIRKKGSKLEIIPFMQKENKMLRIKHASLLYSKEYIYHPRIRDKMLRNIEQQLFNFTEHTKQQLDGADALASAIMYCEESVIPRLEDAREFIEDMKIEEPQEIQSLRSSMKNKTPLF